MKPQPRAQVAAPSRQSSAPIKETPQPPRTTVMPQKALVKAKGRARDSKPFGPVRLTPAARILAKVIVDLAENAEAQVETAETAMLADAAVKKEVRLKRRRRSRLWQFLICEVLAIGALVGCAMLALSHRFTEPTMVSAVNTATLVAAFVAVVIPILFFAFRQTQPWLED
ncbi:MAG: hypothetical protein ABJB69_05425 [Spartobacteria bacterium]